MAKYYLGCRIDFRAYADVKTAIEAELRDGMLLGSLSRVTGVEASTVQNWVKRGYLDSPDGKKYSAGQGAQVILLNTLRDSVPLEKAAAIIKNTVSKSNISAKELLCVLVQSLIRALRFNSVDRASLGSVINSELRDAGYFSKELSSAVLTLALAALSASYREQAQQEAETI